MKYGLTIIAVSLIISVIIGGFFLYPKYQESSNLQKQLNQKQEQLENQQNYLKLLEEISERIEEKQDLIDKVASAIPDEADVPSFLNFLKEEAKNTGIGLEQVRWSQQKSKKEEKKRTNEYLINLEVSGSYFAFRNFLSALESSARLIEVTATDFSMNQEKGEPAIFGLQLRIHSY